MTFDLECRKATLTNSIQGRIYQFRYGFFWGGAKEDEKLTKVEWDLPAITF